MQRLRRQPRDGKDLQSVYKMEVITESRIAAKAATKVSWDALVDIIDRYGSSAIVQRLGYFLDLRQAVLPAMSGRTLSGW